jgi:hypothetical protein
MKAAIRVDGGGAEGKTVPPAMGADQPQAFE